MTEHLPVLVIVVPLFSAILIPLLSKIRQSLAPAVSIIVTGFSLYASIELLLQVERYGTIIYKMGGWQPPFGIEYVVDHLNAFVMIVVSLISFTVSIYSVKSVEYEVDRERIVPFYAVYMLFFTGLMGMVITGDIFNLYVFLEIASLSGYALIAASKKREALMASYNYLIIGTIAATFILLGIGYLYMATGTLNMADLRQRLPEIYESKVVLTASAFFTVGLSLKIALFPLHAWLPNSYTYAPSAVSALLAATATKVGAYAMLRIMFSVFTVRFGLYILPVTKIFIFVAALSILAGSFLAISQKNLKRMLAYSSIGQTGYIFLGACLANPTATSGSILHLFNHALMKCALFLVLGAVIYRTGAERLTDLKGLGKKMPISMAAFTIAGLSMVGVPLTVGFVSKWYIAVGAIQDGMWYIVPVILLSSLMTAIYFGKIIEGIYFHKADKESPAPEREAPLSMLVPTVALSILCLVFGVFASIPVKYAHQAAVALLGFHTGGPGL